MDAPSEAGVFLGGPMVVAVLAACVLSRFAQRDANWLSFLTAVLGVTLAFSIVAVVPYDVWRALLEQEKPLGPDQSPSLLRKCWAAIYWTTTVLCCFIYPVLMSFEDSGDFTVTSRLKASLWRNVLFYVAYLAFGALVLLWLFVRGSVQGDLESWCIAASNAWGLLLLTMLMGFGLVAVPRHFWRLAHPDQQLHSLHAMVLTKDEERLSRQFELQDLICQVRAEVAACLADDEESNGLPLERQNAMATLQRTLAGCEAINHELVRGGCRDGTASEPLARVGGLSPRATTPRGSQTLQLQQLVELHGRLKVAGLEARRAYCRWESHIWRCIFFEDLAEQKYKAAAESLGVRPRANLPCGCCPSLRFKLCDIWCRLLTLWLRTLRSKVLRVMSYASGLLSGIIVLGQLTIFAETWSLSLLSVLFRWDHGPWLTQLLCVAPLGYMTYTAYFSIFRMKIAGWYGLYGNHNTDMGSLLWCASLLGRLAAPLCYHFLLLIRVRGTTFQSFMGRMNVVPVVGESFNQVFPCLVAVLCCLNLLNVYSFIVPYLSLGTLEVEPAAGPEDDPVAEGRKRVERERRRLAEESAQLPTHSPARGPNAPQRLAVPLAAPAG